MDFQGRPTGLRKAHAITLDVTKRDQVVAALREASVLVLAGGERTIRFRPALNVSTEELRVGLLALDTVLGQLSAAARH